MVLKQVTYSWHPSIHRSVPTPEFDSTTSLLTPTLINTELYMWLSTITPWDIQ